MCDGRDEGRKARRDATRKVHCVHTEHGKWFDVGLCRQQHARILLRLQGPEARAHTQWTDGLVSHTCTSAIASDGAQLCVCRRIVWAFGQMSEALVCFGVRVVVRRRYLNRSPSHMRLTTSTGKD